MRIVSAMAECAKYSVIAQVFSVALAVLVVFAAGFVTGALLTAPRAQQPEPATNALAIEVV